MSVEYETTTTETTCVGKLTACVKWFNNKAGYGFITVSEGDHSGEDIFVHHSVINVENQQYKYLVQGEYVEFVLSNAESGAHKFIATSVSGIKGGKLMCETRFEAKTSRTNYAKTNTDETSVEMPSQKELDSSDKVELAKEFKRPRGRPARRVS